MDDNGNPRGVFSLVQALNLLFGAKLSIPSIIEYGTSENYNTNKNCSSNVKYLKALRLYLLDFRRCLRTVRYLFNTHLKTKRCDISHFLLQKCFVKNYVNVKSVDFISRNQHEIEGYFYLCKH